jgi:hypothetical protein
MAVSAESASIFSRVIQPEAGTLPVDLAKYVLSLDFRPEDHARYEELSEKAREGTLTAQEAEQLDGYLHVDSLLSIMRLKANRSLKGGAGASTK